MSDRAFPNPEAMFSAGLTAELLRNEDAGVPQLAMRRLVAPVNESSGFQEINISLADSKLGTGLPYSLAGFELTFCRDGSTPGAVLTLDFGGGNMLRARPGEVMRGRFSTLTISIESDTVVREGNARFVLTKRPDVSFSELPANNVAGGAPVTTTYSQVLGEANVPTLETQGVSLAGVSGGRVFVEAENARTITGGTVRLWIWNTEAERWAYTGIEIDLPTGVGVAVLPDQIFSVPRGRWYAEVYFATVSAGSIAARLEVWGF